MDYYSARLLIVCLIDDGVPVKEHTCDYPFFIFRAKDEESAFRKSLQLGYEQEHGYSNSEGETVRWAFMAVEEIYHLGDDIDGIEVGSLMDVLRSEEEIDFNTVFNPEEKRPVFSRYGK